MRYIYVIMLSVTNVHCAWKQTLNNVHSTHDDKDKIRISQ